MAGFAGVWRATENQADTFSRRMAAFRRGFAETRSHPPARAGGFPGTRLPAGMRGSMRLRSRTNLSAFQVRFTRLQEEMSLRTFSRFLANSARKSFVRKPQ